MRAAHVHNLKDTKMSDFQGKYKVINFQWGYIIASFDTLRAAMAYCAKRGMRTDHRRGETSVYATL